MLRALYAAGCDEICVSLNAAEPASYAEMMRTTGKNFDRVVDNIRLAAALKRETGASTVLRVQFLVYKRQLPRASRDAPRLPRERRGPLLAERPLPRPPHADDGRVGHRRDAPRSTRRSSSQDYFERLERFSFWERVDRGPHRGVDAARLRAGASGAPRARSQRAAALRPGGPPSAPRPRGLHEFCLVGWYGTTLNANGDAVTCCILQDHPTAVLGNIHRRTLGEIWHGEGYERFRAELREIGEW